jgi:putative oxidoreductase
LFIRLLSNNFADALLYIYYIISGGMAHVNKTSKISTLLFRLYVVFIFFSEGLKKYLFPVELGTGRFEKIGFSNPAFWAYFTGTFEMVCGILILIGLFTRLAAIPLFIIMIVSFITTKYPELAEKGFWFMAHDYRTDFAMTLLLIYLLIYGGGKNSMDYKIQQTLKPPK